MLFHQHKSSKSACTSNFPREEPDCYAKQPRGWSRERGECGEVVWTCSKSRPVLLGEQLGSAGLSECALHPASLHPNHLDVCSQVHPRAKPYIDSQNSPKTLTAQNTASERLSIDNSLCWNLERNTFGMNYFCKFSVHSSIYMDLKLVSVNDN